MATDAGRFTFIDNFTRGPVPVHGGRFRSIDLVYLQYIEGQKKKTNLISQTTRECSQNAKQFKNLSSFDYKQDNLVQLHKEFFSHYFTQIIFSLFNIKR